MLILTFTSWSFLIPILISLMTHDTLGPRYHQQTSASAESPTSFASRLCKCSKLVAFRLWNKDERTWHHEFKSYQLQYCGIVTEQWALMEFVITSLFYFLSSTSGIVASAAILAGFISFPRNMIKIWVCMYCILYLNNNLNLTNLSCWEIAPRKSHDLHQTIQTHFTADFEGEPFKLEKTWSNASVDLDECRAVVAFDMASFCYILSDKVHDNSYSVSVHNFFQFFHIFPMNLQAGPTTGWKTRRQTRMCMVGGWALSSLSLLYLAFWNWSLDNFNGTSRTVNGGTVPYKAIFYWDIPLAMALYRPYKW